MEKNLLWSFFYQCNHRKIPQELRFGGYTCGENVYYYYTEAVAEIKYSRKFLISDC